MKMPKLKLNGSGASTGAIYLMFVRLLTIVLGFVIARILSEYLTTYDYGTYSQAMLVVSTLSSMTQLGMADGVNFFFCKEQNNDKREKFVSTIFSLQYIVGSIVAFVLILLAVPICLYFDNESLRPLIYISALLPVFQNLISMLQVLFISIGKSKSIAIRNLICSVIKLITVIVACIYVKSIAIILISSLIVDGVQCVFFYHVLHKNNCNIRIRKTDFSLVGTILSYTMPMAAFTLVSTFTRDMDKYVISTFMDTEKLAIYSNASKILPFDIVMASFITVLLPYITNFIAKKKLKEASVLYKQFLELTYITTTIMATAVLICSSEVMTLLYTEKYLEGLVVFCIYILVDIIRFTNITLVLSAAGKTKTIMCISLIGVGLNLLFNILFYFVIGFEGPAIATLLVTSIMGILFLCCSAKELNTTACRLFDFKFMLLFLIEIVVVGVACFILKEMLSSLGIHYIFVLLITVSIYGITMLALNWRKLLRILKNIETTKLETLSNT